MEFKALHNTRADPVASTSSQWGFFIQQVGFQVLQFIHALLLGNYFPKSSTCDRNSCALCMHKCRNLQYSLAIHVSQTLQGVPRKNIVIEDCPDNLPVVMPLALYISIAVSYWGDLHASICLIPRPYWEQGWPRGLGRRAADMVFAFEFDCSMQLLKATWH